MDWRQLVEEGEVRGGERLERRQFDHGLGLAFEQHRQDDDARGLGLAQAGLNLRVVRRHVGEQDPLLFHGALADQAFAQRDVLGLVPALGVTGQEAQRRRSPSPVVHLVDRALLRVDQRRQFREQHLAHGDQVALALQHAGELGEVGLQPVLLLVALRGVAQIADHRVDVVLQLGHFAAGFDLDGARQVALGHGGGDFGDGAHLGA